MKTIVLYMIQTCTSMGIYPIALPIMLTGQVTSLCHCTGVLFSFLWLDFRQIPFILSNHVYYGTTHIAKVTWWPERLEEKMEEASTVHPHNLDQLIQQPNIYSKVAIYCSYETVFWNPYIMKTIVLYRIRTCTSMGMYPIALPIMLPGQVTSHCHCTGVLYSFYV